MTSWIRLIAASCVVCVPFAGGWMSASRHYAPVIAQCERTSAAYDALKRASDTQNDAIASLQRQAQARASAAASAMHAATLAARTKTERAQAILDAQSDGDRCAAASALIDQVLSEGTR